MGKKNSISYAKYGYLFSIPFVITFLLCTLYPVIYTAFIGFTNMKGLTPTNVEVVPTRKPNGEPKTFSTTPFFADKTISNEDFQKLIIEESFEEILSDTDFLAFKAQAESEGAVKTKDFKKYINNAQFKKVNTKNEILNSIDSVTKKSYKKKEHLFMNFEQVLKKPSFRTAVSNTFLMWIVNFIPQIVLALVLAAWFSNEQNNIKGKGFFKVVFYMPNIITASTIAILFASLFAYPTSPVNDLLLTLGLIEKPFDFPQSKLAARLIVSFIQFWMWYGYTMIVLTSGILGINPEIYEAAEIDGANGIQKFFKITLPNLKTILLYTLVTSLIGGLQMYDIPSLLMQNSGPDNATLTSSVFIYNQAFKGSYLWNQSSAASMIMFVIIAALSAVMFFLLRDKDEAKLNKMNKMRIKEFKKQQKLNAKGGNK